MRFRFNPAQNDKRHSSGRWGGIFRRVRVSGVATLGAVFLASAVFAQSQLEFADPLEEIRSRIEQSETDQKPARTPSVSQQNERAGEDSARPAQEDVLSKARGLANAGVEETQQKALGFWGKMKLALSDIASGFGLSTGGLIGLLGALLAGLALLVGWTLFRATRAPRLSEDGLDDDVYARDATNNNRRRTFGTRTPVAVVPEPAFAEKMPDSFEDIFTEQRESVHRAEETTVDAIPAKSMDPEKWRKPGLDRLRDSIRADWKASKAEAKGEPDARPVDEFDSRIAGDDPADLAMADLSSGWDEWDDKADPESDVWGKPVATAEPVDDQTETEALRRIRELRESLRAS